jgi:hypothetical protein
MKRNDFILAGLVLLIAIIALFYINITKKNGDKAIIRVDGKIYKEVALNKDITIRIPGAEEGTNLLVIKDGIVDMTDASCPDKLCVHHKPIRYNGESIICLPNKVSVEIVSRKDQELDAVVN